MLYKGRSCASFVCLGGEPSHRPAHDSFDHEPDDRSHPSARLKLDSPCELGTRTQGFEHKGASVVAHWRTREQRIAEPSFRLESGDLLADRSAPRSDRAYLSDTTRPFIAWLFDNNGSYPCPPRHRRRVGEHAPDDRRRSTKLFYVSQGDHIRAVS